MTYAESIEFLYGLRLFGLKLGLENTRRLAARAGNPQDRLRFIHIAGTNGKGSVAAMLESIYRHAGLRVGLFTSPHLVSFRERIQVNRHWISETQVIHHVNTLLAQNENQESKLKTQKSLTPTFFEFTTVLALNHFAEQHCELVIWETGLGGRLDATNIVTPLASVITNIESDHQHWLGHDLRSIAGEKAGIIKPGIPVITATQEPEALTVIQSTALDHQSPFTLVAPSHTTHPPLNTIQLPLLGWHQRMNAAVAVATVEALRPQLPVDDSSLRAGLESVRWPGRLQLVRDRFLLDGAHNAAAATSLRAVLEEDFAGRHRTLILGILADKDWTLMCRILAPTAMRILCVPVKSERGVEPADLAAECRRTNPAARVETFRAIRAALEAAGSDPLVVIAGSLYLVGEALDLLESSADRSAADEQALNDWRGPGTGPP